MVLLTGCVSAKTGSKTSAAPKSVEPPATHAITRGSLRAKLQLDAVFQATEMQAIKLEPKAWMDLTVMEVVPHGARVKKGDVLLKLDLEKLRDQIDDIEKDQPLGALGMEQAAAELENLVQGTPQKLEAARRGARVADEELAYFDKTGREQREKNAKFTLKNAEQRLENALEELKQLEKMYKNDDLVEETEEIILKRQRFAVESAQFYLDATRLSTDRDLKTMIPREAETLKAQKRDQELALTLAEETLPKALAKKRLDVEKLKRDQKKTEKRLADLKHDLQQLTVRSPMDGVVYYGACESGKWTTGAAIAKKLMPGSKLMPIEILLTVVNPEKMVLKGIIPEAELAKFKTGMAGQAALVSAPDKKLAVTLEEIGSVPAPIGGFEATLCLAAERPATVVPGMNAKVTLSESLKQDVLLAPSDAVFTEGAQKYVFVAKPDGKSEKRFIKTGDTENKQVEILEGLAEGDKILLKAPLAK
jgi:multidrug efflux pump subunit AcrA (membrane-fusion protein)